MSDHLVHDPASKQRLCMRCGNSGHIDTLAECAAGQCDGDGEPRLVPVSARSVNETWELLRERARAGRDVRRRLQGE